MRCNRSSAWATEMLHNVTNDRDSALSVERFIGIPLELTVFIFKLLE
jgi:hypothetical protein